MILFLCLRKDGNFNVNTPMMSETADQENITNSHDQLERRQYMRIIQYWLYENDVDHCGSSIAAMFYFHIRMTSHVK